MNDQEAFVRLGARYWADFLRTNAGPEALRDTGVVNEGVEGLRRGAMLDTMVGAIRNRMPAVTAEQADAFELALMHRLLTDRHCMAPSVDYHPNYTLMEALATAGIDKKNADLRFPWKTHTAIDADGVHVREGNADGRSLVMTKRKAIYDALIAAYSQSDRDPYSKPRDHEANPITDQEREVHEACWKRIYAVRDLLPPMPPGRIEEIIAKALRYVVGEAEDFAL